MPDKRKSYTVFRDSRLGVIAQVNIVGSTGRNEASYWLKRLFHEGDPPNRGTRFDWAYENPGARLLAFSILGDYFKDNRPKKNSLTWQLMNRFGAQFLWFAGCKPDYILIITTQHIDEWMDKIAIEDAAARDNLNESEKRGAEHVE